jgi:hypothetical protein
VVIEAGHFVDFGHGHLHLCRERHEMRSGKTAEPILNFVEMLNEEVGTPRCVAEEREHFGASLRLDGSPFGRAAYARTLAF